MRHDFFHNFHSLVRVEIVRERNDPNAKLKTVSTETKEILAELERDYKAPESKETLQKEKADKFNAVRKFLRHTFFHRNNYLGM